MTERAKVEKKLLATIAKADALQARYDKMRADGTLKEKIDFMESD